LFALTEFFLNNLLDFLRGQHCILWAVQKVLFLRLNHNNGYLLVLSLTKAPVPPNSLNTLSNRSEIYAQDEFSSGTKREMKITSSMTFLVAFDSSIGGISAFPAKERI
jgi:Na+/melibiose symporter-like transporter